MFQPSAAARDDTAVPGASQSPQPPSGTGGSSASTDLSSTLTPDSPPSISRQSSSSSEDALGPSTATGARREKRERGAGTEKLMPKSCLGCRARKVRCPRNLVACERCIRRGDTCTYDAEVHRTAPPRSRGGEQRHKPARSTSSITTFASLKSLPLPTSPSPTGIDVASRVYAAFVKAIPALHHLVLCEYLLASFRTGPGAWTSTPSLATTLVWTLLDAALDSCSLHLPAFQPLEQKIAGYKDRLHMLDAAGSLAVVILCTIGARSSPQTELFDVACDFAGSDQSSTVEQVGARREAVCRALVDVATELGTATELVVGRDNLESLVSLSQLFVEEFELPRGRIATRMAWGMLSDVGGLEKGVLPAMGLVLFRNDSIIAATLQRSFIVHLSDLSEFASTQSLRLPDFAEDNFSSVLATLGAPGILSHEQLTRCTTFANGWTANCYRVFTKVSMSLDRQQGDSSDSAVAALEIRAVWRRIDFIHTLVQRLQQRVASSASSNPQNALGLQENALLFVRTDSRLIGLMFLLHKLLVRRSAWQGSRESGESSRELLVESYSRVRKSLKLLSFYAGLYLRSRDKHLLHHLIVELNLLPDWTLLASQRVGDADGPRATEDEMTDLELETLKRAVGVACFYTPLAVQRLSELIIGRNTMQNYSGASISPSQDDLADALPTDVLRQARSAISPATIAPFVDTQTHAMLDQGYFDPEASPSTSVYPFPNSTYAPEAPSELPSSFLPASLSTDASFSLPARARLDGSAEEDDDWMSVLLAAPWGGEVDSDLRLGVSPAEVVQDEVMQDWDCPLGRFRPLRLGTSLDLDYPAPRPPLVALAITKRKQPVRDPADTSLLPPAFESGTKASCDSCSADITHNVHVRCAETTKPASGEGERLTCPDFDLCVPCFLVGKSVGPHRPHHAYRIISSHSFPIFTPDWGADEELLLIEGAELYGLGNWADMADHVGGRTKEECEEHYHKTYLESAEYPMPVTNVDFRVDQDTFQARKKQRLEELHARPLTLPPPKPLASAPTCHEVGGFMPGRLEFETEYENEAETLVKDMEFGKVYQFGGDEQPGPEVEEVKPEITVPGEEKDTGDENEDDLELKLAILEMFNERYDRRMAAKELIFDRGLMNYKQLLQNERKKTKEERDLVLRCKVFARIQTAEDHEVFVDGLLYELALRKRISELQDYRRMGVTSLAEGERYDHGKAQRVSAKQTNYRDSLVVSYDRTAARQTRLPGLKTRPSTGALTLANSSSLHLLTVLEQQLCSTLRILPRPYLFLKEALLREWAKSGGRMGSEEARKVVVRGEGEAGGEWGEKVERVWEFLVETGGLRRVEKEGEAKVNGVEVNGEEKGVGGEAVPMDVVEEVRVEVVEDSATLASAQVTV